MATPKALPSRGFKENASIKWDNFKEGLRDFAFNNNFGELLGVSPVLRHYVYNDPNTSAEEALVAAVVPGEGLVAKAAGRAAGSALVKNSAKKVLSPKLYLKLLDEGRAPRSPLLLDARSFMRRQNRIDPGTWNTNESLDFLRRLYLNQLQSPAERELDEYLFENGMHINGMRFRQQGGTINYSKFYK